MVLVHDFDGYPLGRGFINRNSKLMVRMMTRDRDTQVDEGFLRMRVKNAWEYRKKVMDDISSCRVIFGEADFLPGLVIDKFADVLVVESLALGIDRFKVTIVDILKELMEADGIHIRGVYERSDAKVREQEGMERIKGFIGEPFDTKVEIVENGVRYYVDVKDGQKNRILPGSEIQPPRGGETLQRSPGTGLLYPYRLLRSQCRAGRGGARAGRGRIRTGRGTGKRKCGTERPLRPGGVPLRGCV